MSNDFINFAKEIPKMKPKINKAIELWANRVIDDLYDSIYKVTPKDTGNLREALVKNLWDGNYAEIYFDGDLDYIRGVKVKDYIWYVHENLFQNYTTEGTSYKFVEKPFDENLKKYEHWFDAMVGGAIEWI